MRPKTPLNFRVRMLVAAAWLITAGVALAAAVEPPTASALPSVDVHTLMGETHTGRLTSWDPVDGVSLVFDSDRREVHIPSEQLVRIVARSLARKPSPDSVRVELKGGDRLFGDPATGQGDQVMLQNSLMGPVAIPIQRITRWTTLPPRIRGSEAAQGWAGGAGVALGLPSPGASPQLNDRILLTNGDWLHGFISRIDASGFTWVAAEDHQELVLPHESIVQAEPASDSPSRPRPAALRIRLADGSVISANRASMVPDSQRLGFSDIEDNPFSIGFGEWQEIEFLENPWTWLSRLQPISVSHQSMSREAWDPQIDRNVLGRPMRVAGTRFDHGLGVHSASTLVYDLGAEFRLLAISYGLDDDSGPWACVDVSIRVDGQVRHHEPSVRPGRSYGPISLDMSGASRLELVVDFGAGRDVQDRFDWVDATLIRK